MSQVHVFTLAIKVSTWVSLFLHKPAEKQMWPNVKLESESYETLEADSIYFGCVTF